MKKNNKKSVNRSKKSNGHVVIKATTPVLVPIPVVPTVPVIPSDVDQIAMTLEQSVKVKELEQRVLQAKLQLADVGLQLSDLQDQKSQLVNFIKDSRLEMLTKVRQVAESFGIDVDGSKDSRRWNLDTNEMVFRLIKDRV